MVHTQNILLMGALFYYFNEYLWLYLKAQETGEERGKKRRVHLSYFGPHHSPHMTLQSTYDYRLSSVIFSCAQSWESTQQKGQHCLRPIKICNVTLTCSCLWLSGTVLMRPKFWKHHQITQNILADESPICLRAILHTLAHFLLPPLPPSGSFKALLQTSGTDSWRWSCLFLVTLLQSGRGRVNPISLFQVPYSFQGCHRGRTPETQVVA